MEKKKEKERKKEKQSLQLSGSAENSLRVLLQDSSLIHGDIIKNVSPVTFALQLSRAHTHTHSLAALRRKRPYLKRVPPGHREVEVLRRRTAGGARSGFRQQFRVAVVTR